MSMSELQASQNFLETPIPVRKSSFTTQQKKYINEAKLTKQLATDKKIRPFSKLEKLEKSQKLVDDTTFKSETDTKLEATVGSLNVSMTASVKQY